MPELLVENIHLISCSLIISVTDAIVSKYN